MFLSCWFQQRLCIGLTLSGAQVPLLICSLRPRGIQIVMGQACVSWVSLAQVLAYMDQEYKKDGSQGNVAFVLKRCILDRQKKHMFTLASKLEKDILLDPVPNGYHVYIFSSIHSHSLIFK